MEPKPTEAPVQPDNNQPAQPQQPAGGATQTGDTTGLLTWITLAGLMAAGMALTLRKLRRNG